MARKKKVKSPEVRVMAGVTTAAPITWRENVRPEGKIVIFDIWCKRCGICVEFCPTNALEDRGDGLPVLAYPDKCTLCGLCWLRCPDMAIIKGPELPENEPVEQEAERTRKRLKGENVGELKEDDSKGDTGTEKPEKEKPVESEAEE